MGLVDLASLAGAAVDGHVLAALAAAGLEGLRTRHGYVVQRLLVGPATATALARDLGVTQQAMSKTVAELRALGYVETVADPADARARPVGLSAEGRRTVEVARAARSRLLRQLRARVGADRAGVAADVLGELLDVLDVGRHLATRTVPAPRGAF